jgi:hypothetical protein
MEGTRASLSGPGHVAAERGRDDGSVSALYETMVSLWVGVAGDPRAKDGMSPSIIDGTRFWRVRIETTILGQSKLFRLIPRLVRAMSLPSGSGYFLYAILLFYLCSIKLAQALPDSDCSPIVLEFFTPALEYHLLLILSVGQSHLRAAGLIFSVLFALRSHSLLASFLLPHAPVRRYLGISERLDLRKDFWSSLVRDMS